MKEGTFSDSVKIQGKEQCESQKDVSTSEHLLRHCHIVTVSTARCWSSSIPMNYEWHCALGSSSRTVSPNTVITRQITKRCWFFYF